MSAVSCAACTIAEHLLACALLWHALKAAGFCQGKRKTENGQDSTEVAEPTVEEVEAEFWRVIETPEEVAPMLAPLKS